MSLSPEQLESILTRVEKAVILRLSPLNKGMDDALSQVVRDITLEILKKDEKAKKAIAKIVRNWIVDSFYSEKDHRETVR